MELFNQNITSRICQNLENKDQLLDKFYKNHQNIFISELRGELLKKDKDAQNYSQHLKDYIKNDPKFKTLNQTDNHQSPILENASSKKNSIYGKLKPNSIPTFIQVQEERNKSTFNRSSLNNNEKEIKQSDPQRNSQTTFESDSNDKIE